MMDAPEWLEPTGFVCFGPAHGGNIWADVYRRIIARTAEGVLREKIACLVQAPPG